MFLVYREKNAGSWRQRVKKSVETIRGKIRQFKFGHWWQTKILPLVMLVIVMAGYFERMVIDGVTSYQVLKIFLVGGLIIGLVAQRKRVKIFWQNWQTMIIGGMVLASTISCFLSIFPEESINYLINLLMGISSYAFFFLTVNGGQEKKYKNYIVGLAFLSAVSWWLYIIIGHETAKSLLAIFFDQATVLNFDYHHVAEGQMMFLDVAHQLFPLLVAGWIVKRKEKTGIFLAFIWLSLLVSIVFSNSRTYVVTTVVAVLLLLFYQKKYFNNNWKEELSRRLVWLVLPLGIVILGLGLSQKINHLTVANRLFSGNGLESRLIIGQYLWPYFLDRPEWGVGQGMVAKLVPETIWNQSYISYLNTNNLPTDYAEPTAYSFINIVIENGIIGGGMWLLVMMFFVGHDLCWLKTQKKPDILLWSLMMSSYLYYLTAITDVPSGAETLTFWMVRGVIAAKTLQVLKISE